MDNSGMGNTANSSTPVEVDLGEGQMAVAVGTGDNHTCAVLNDGSLVCWGDNGNGQLGDGTTTDRNAPVAVDLGEGRTAVGISLGELHTCAHLDDGSLVCWGANNYGQVGSGGNTRQNPSPVSLGSGVTARAVSAGGAHTCAILDNGKVQCWGLNDYGQLGDESANPLGTSTPVPVTLESQRTATAISSGGRHTCAILDDGSLVCWGRNDGGQLGDGSSTSRDVPVDVDTGDKTAVAVTTGYYHTCALLDDNSVVCWGSNDFGQIGDETIVNKNTPTDVDLGDKAVASIRAGGDTSCALFEDGSVTCWGNNEHGQLGTGQGLSVLAPQTVDTGDETVTAIDGGLGHSCGLFEDGDGNVKFKCWGGNDSGQLGIGSLPDFHTLNRFNPIHVFSNVTQLSLGTSYSCLILNTDILTCWGENGSGQLGLGDTTDRTYYSTGVNLGTGKTASAVSAGHEHTCAILNDDKIKCWGKGGHGQLGNGADSNQNSPVAVTMGGSVTAEKISVGGQHACAILNDNKVYCWGRNNVGQLGIGLSDVQDIKKNIPTVVNLGTDKTATAISTGDFHTCAILNDNSVKCWGNNSYGELGNGANTGSNTPVAVSLGSGRTATAIHAKGSYTCAILDDGSLKCWGRNSVGQLGDGTTTNRTTPVTVDLGAGRIATAVGGGNSHNCALLDDESLKCWGYNNHGQTGLPTVHRGDQPGEMGENLIFVDFK